ncbi:MAG: disulfide reductase [Syntrophomonadaceae bacterium]|nr:disulfide reductase [Syntrophomonadaceae bacterium]
MNEARVIAPEELIPSVPETIFLFRSCTGSMEYPGTENAIKEVLDKLGINIVMDPDQTCCSGYLLTCSAHKPELSLAVTARNLAIVEQKNLDTYMFCNGCYGYNRELAHILKHNPAYMQMANDIIAKQGYHYEGKTGIFHVQELWYRLKKELVARAVVPLNGLKVGVHYGCHYLAQQYQILDDGGYPTFQEELLAAFGAEPVFYKERQACCGYSVGRGFTHKESVVQPHLFKKFKSAKEAGVDLMTTTCPGCNVGLDREQPNLAKRYGEEFDIPVIDLSQLLGLALGVPLNKLGFEANTVPLDKVIEKLGLKKGE